MTDLLSLLLRQSSKEGKEAAAEKLNAALQAQAVLSALQASPPAPDSSSAFAALSPAPQLAEEYEALRQAVSVFQPTVAETARSASPLDVTAPSQRGQLRSMVGEEQGDSPYQRLIIKEGESGIAIAPAQLDRLFQRDARRYDNGFTLY